MKLNIMTWNCSLYKEEISKLNWVRYNSIVNIIKGRLELENSIVVLQEIPYKTRETRKLHPFFEQIKKDFPEDKYDSFFSESNKNQIMMTVILSKKNVLEDYSGVGSIYNNRIVCCKIQDVIIAGVHMPTSFEKLRNDDEKTKSLKNWKESVWDNLIKLARANAKGNKESTSKLIILGDFNAFIGCKDKLTESKFIELHRYVNDIIPDDVPTYYIGDTPIDHIFVNFNTQLKHKFQVEDNDYYNSDHKYINAEFNFN